jgi:hypothetical protein
LPVANANYSQPLLVTIGASPHLTGDAVGLLSALTQAGELTGRVAGSDAARAYAKDLPLDTMVKLPRQFSRKRT